MTQTSKRRFKFRRHSFRIFLIFKILHLQMDGEDGRQYCKKIQEKPNQKLEKKLLSLTRGE